MHMGRHAQQNLVTVISKCARSNLCSGPRRVNQFSRIAARFFLALSFSQPDHSSRLLLRKYTAASSPEALLESIQANRELMVLVLNVILLSISVTSGSRSLKSVVTDVSMVAAGNSDTPGLSAFAFWFFS